MDLLLIAGIPLLVAAAAVLGVVLTTSEPPLYLGRVFRGAEGVFLVAFLVRDTGGASPGKRLFGLKIVRLDGVRTTVATSLVRNLPLLLPGWNLIEAASVLRRHDGRRPGDRAARTAVVEA